MLRSAVSFIALSSAVHAVIESQTLGGVVLQASGMPLALAVLQLGMGTQVWRYHGAEHKVVNAYEARADLRDVAAVKGFSRIHDRCGTNLVPIAVALELFRLIERSPRTPFCSAAGPCSEC